MCAHLQEFFKAYWWCWGADSFSRELAGAVNRCNYNQRNAQLNAMAGTAAGATVVGQGSRRLCIAVKGHTNRCKYNQRNAQLIAMAGAAVLAPAEKAVVGQEPRQYSTATEFTQLCETTTVQYSAQC